MSTARRLVLENRLGHRVRVLDVGNGPMTLIYRRDTRRVETHSNPQALRDQGIEFNVLASVSPAAVDKNGFDLPHGLGRIRSFDEADTSARPVYELPAEDDQERMGLMLKKSSIGHVVGVVVLVLLSFIMMKLKEMDEPRLVTIVVPQAKPVQKAPQRVKVARKKITPTKKRVAKRTVVKRSPVKPRRQVKTKTRAATRRVVHTRKPRNLNNVGALAALGGLKNGSRNARGLDSSSLRNIRSAGVGGGGGGVGGLGRGGIHGAMPGTGLIAGSTGRGARAAGAGGYGTRGQGGGRAGYGKISLVGNIGGTSLPLDDEATVEGGLTRDQIAAVINRHRGQIVYCYEQALQGRPDLRGRVAVDFVIGASGRVSRARVSQSSLESRQVESCIVARLKTWKFPRPVGGVNVDVEYPFELRRVTSQISKR